MAVLRLGDEACGVQIAESMGTKPPNAYRALAALLSRGLVEARMMPMRPPVRGPQRRGYYVTQRGLWALREEMQRTAALYEEALALLGRDGEGKLP